MSWTASAVAWMPPWPARRQSRSSAAMRAAAKPPCSKPLPPRRWRNIPTWWSPARAAVRAAAPILSVPCAGLPRCSSATSAARWPGIWPGRRQRSGCRMPRAWPWRASKSTVPTLPARSFPQPPLHAAPAYLLTLFADGPPCKGPCRKGPCPKASSSTSCSALWRRSPASDRCSCSWTIFIGWTTRPQPFSCTSAASSLAAACWCSARTARSPWGCAGATPPPPRRPAIPWRPPSTSCAG